MCSICWCRTRPIDRSGGSSPRAKNATWDDAVEVVAADAMRGWFADAYGNLTIIYDEGTQAYARRFR
jgi:hypothetical protein